MIGRFIVRYDSPAGIGITIRKTFGPGHSTIKGDKDVMKRCLVPDEVSTV